MQGDRNTEISGREIVWFWNVGTKTNQKTAWASRHIGMRHPTGITLFAHATWLNKLKRQGMPAVVNIHINFKPVFGE